MYPLTARLMVAPYSGLFGSDLGSIPSFSPAPAPPPPPTFPVAAALPPPPFAPSSASSSTASFFPPVPVPINTTILPVSAASVSIPPQQAFPSFTSLSIPNGIVAGGGLFPVAAATSSYVSSAPSLPQQQQPNVASGVIATVDSAPSPPITDPTSPSPIAPQVTKLVYKDGAGFIASSVPYPLTATLSSAAGPAPSIASVPSPWVGPFAQPSARPSGTTSPVPQPMTQNVLLSDRWRTFLPTTDSSHPTTFTSLFPDHAAMRHSARHSIGSLSSHRSPYATPMYSPFATPRRPDLLIPTVPGATGPQWLFQDPNLGWASFSADQSAVIEAGFQRQPSAKCTVTLKGEEWETAFDTFLLRNTKDGREMKMMRVQSGSQERCIRCQRKLKWRSAGDQREHQQRTYNSHEVFTCNECDSVCERSHDNFVRCPVCEWYVCQRCQKEGEEIGEQHKQQQRISSALSGPYTPSDQLGQSPSYATLLGTTSSSNIVPILSMPIITTMSY